MEPNFDPFKNQVTDINDLGKTKGDKSHEIKLCGVDSSQAGLYVPAKILGESITLLLDSGADVTIFSYKTLEVLKKKRNFETEPSNIKLISASGDHIPIEGTCELPIQIGSHTYSYRILIADIKFDGILGLDFMTTYSCDIFIKTLSMRIKGEQVPLIRLSQNNLDLRCKVVVAEDTILPPNSENLVAGRVIGPTPTCNLVIIEPNFDFVQKYGVFVANALQEPNMGNIPLRVLNPSNDSLTLHQNCSIAILEEVHDTQQCMSDKS